MEGAVPNEDLGIAGRALMRTSNNKPYVCENCSNYDETHSDPDSCRRNIILNGKFLTSGYKQGQKRIKPNKTIKEKLGKCNHGGKGDKYRFTIPSGGINKETSDPEWSPHYHLHESAGSAALNASMDFFFGKATSLVNVIPNAAFEELMNLQLGASIVFVIDDTGSMSDEIEAVKEWTINKVRSTAGTKAAPFDYILSVFNDPEERNRIYSTRNPQEMIDELSKLVAHDGGDCAELATQGIMAALDKCHPYSTLFVFTDAPSKNESLIVDILKLAKEKNVKISTLLTPGCSRKKREAILDIKRRRTKRASGFDLYKQIADETGGRVYHTTNKMIDETLVVIDESLSSKPVEVLQKIITETNDEPLTIPVDNQMSGLAIEVSDVSNLGDVQLFTPTGDEETFSSVDDTRSMISTNIMLMKKSAPTAGLWTLKQKVGTKVTVYVRGTGDISFWYTLRESASDGLLYPINGLPLADHNYTVAVTMYRGDKIQDLHYLLIVTNKGDIIDTAPVTTASTQSFTATVFVTNEAFMLAVNGTDTSGFPFLRMVKKLIRPVSIKLEMLPFEGELAAGELFNVTYGLVNEGPDTLSTTVELVHSEQVTSLSSVKEHNLASKEIIKDQITIIAAKTESLVHLKLILTVDGEIFQEISRMVMIADIYAPVCNVITTSNGCRNVMKKDCATSSWNAIFEIFDKGFGLQRVFSPLNDSMVRFSHDSFPDGYNGIVGGSISGSCCHEMEVRGEDKGGAVGSCFLTPEFRPLDTKPENVHDHTLVIVLCVAGGSVFILVFLIVIPVIIYKWKR